LGHAHLATWILSRLGGLADAEEAIRYVAPVGEKDEYVAQALAAVTPFLPAAKPLAA
jgi:hypothetical protein